jgi:2-polyprenyl-6-methoxyphenol hydroxylase-like FAD-dependent oxidoreductase
MMSSPLQSMQTEVCIAGGGPAGMMLGLLLARAGIDVIVLEKHADFLRDFRGDTIHPSTLDVIHELGLLDAFLRLPHQEVSQIAMKMGAVRVPVADFTHLSTRCRFIAMMPQWDFLAFLAGEATRYSNFKLRMPAQVTGLIETAGRVAGVIAKTPEGQLEIHAGLTIGADGRASTVREKAALAVEELGTPIDVLWFRLARGPGDPDDTAGYFGPRNMFVMINRGDYWQCAYVISKGGFAAIKAAGLPAFRAGIAQLAPFAADATTQLQDWEAVSLLTVRVDRLTQWQRPGLLCIGDAAHAMSPVGGVGINLAIQDAVAAANLLVAPLREHRVTEEDLKQVQRRRELPTRVTQWFQVMVQNRVIANVLAGTGLGSSSVLPLPLRLLGRYPILRRIPARLIGVGVRPEHVRSPVVTRVPAP